MKQIKPKNSANLKAKALLNLKQVKKNEKKNYWNKNEIKTIRKLYRLHKLQKNFLINKFFI